MDSRVPCGSGWLAVVKCINIIKHSHNEAWSNFEVLFYLFALIPMIWWYLMVPSPTCHGHSPHLVAVPLGTAPNSMTRRVSSITPLLFSHQCWGPVILKIRGDGDWHDTTGYPYISIVAYMYNWIWIQLDIKSFGIHMWTKNIYVSEGWWLVTYPVAPVPRGRHHQRRTPLELEFSRVVYPVAKRTFLMNTFIFVA